MFITIIHAPKNNIFMKIIVTIFIIIFLGCYSHRSYIDIKYEPDFEVFSEIKSENDSKMFDFYLHRIDSSKITIDMVIDTTVAIKSIVTTNKTGVQSSPDTGYEFLLNKSGILEIDFYDFSETLISNVFSEFLKEGIYELNLENVKVESGAYILKLKFKEDRINKKLLLTP